MTENGRTRRQSQRRDLSRIMLRMLGAKPWRGSSLTSGNKMKTLALLLIILVAFAAPANSATRDSWVAEPPSSISFKKQDAIPAADVYEVVASMRENAEAELQKIPLLPLSEAQARKFTGEYYSCPKGKRPFLTRALFGFAGTGKFWVYRIKREIWVLHESLGAEFVSRRTALVLNLDFDPAKAYVTVSIVR